MSWLGWTAVVIIGSNVILFGALYAIFLIERRSMHEFNESRNRNYCKPEK